MSSAPLAADAHHGEETLDGLLTAGLRDARRPALHHGEQTISFGELDERARRVAGGLSGLGVGSGGRVAVWLPACPEWLEVYLGAARLGALVLAVNTRLQAREVEQLISRAQPKGLVLWPDFRGVDFAGILADVDPSVLDTVSHVITVRGGGELPRPAVELDELRAADPLDEAPGAPEDRTIVFSSSGTTSAPKLVAHTQRSVVGHATAVGPAQGYTDPDAVILNPLPMCGTFGFTALMAALHAGRPSVLMDVFDGAAADALVQTHGATHTVGGDDMLRAMFEAAEGDQLATLRRGFYALFSGDGGQLLTLGERHGVALHGGYGSSELHALFTRIEPDAPAEQRALMGGAPVYESAVVRVRDPESGELLAPGEEGELEIFSPTALDGLIDDPVRERERFTEDGFVLTGDLGYVTEDGRMVYLRRAGDVMRLSGFLVAPREVEEVLEAHPDVHRAQVLEVRVDEAPRPFAFVVAEPGHEVDEAAVLAACDGRLARFKQPVRIVAVDAFPYVSSPNGNKIDRRTLSDRAQEIVTQDPAGAD